MGVCVVSDIFVDGFNFGLTKKTFCALIRQYPFPRYRGFLREEHFDPPKNKKIDHKKIKLKSLVVFLCQKTANLTSK